MWYIIHDNRQCGPMPAEELRKYGLNPASIVWRPGMSDWQTAATCPELAGLIGDEIPVNPYASTPGNNRGGYPDEQGNFPGKQGGNPQGYGPSQRIPDPNNPGNWMQQSGDYSQGYYQQPYDPSQQWSGKSKLVAGLLAIFLGYLGIQYFYVGKTTGGLLTILLSIVTCGMWGILTFIQGIYMLTLTDRQFDDKYVYTTSAFPIF